MPSAQVQPRDRPANPRDFDAAWKLPSPANSRTGDTPAEYNPVMRARTTWSVGLVFAGLAVVRPAAQEPATIEALLARAGEYVNQLERNLSGIVAEEHYTQDVIRLLPSISLRGSVTSQPPNQHRDLKSDVLLVRPMGAERYIQFRDVFEVDGKPVRDRDDRLARLFLNPAASSAEQLQDIKEDSARYNIGNISRDLNVPVLALMFLHLENQPRFTFTVAKAGAAGQPWDIAYRETRPDTFIRTTGQRDLPARGRFRIDPTGRVLMSELVAEDPAVHADITVNYQLEPMLGFLVPIEMKESFSTPRGPDIHGRATYGRFRRFGVSTDEKIAQ